MSSSTQHLVISKVPLVYKIWFLYFEPFAALNGAYLLHFQPQTYLRMTHCPTADISPIPSSTLFIMDQLAAQFLCFALIEAFVMRTTSDVKVWKAIFCCMLVCDAVCLSALRGLGGSEAYWVSPWLWDAVGWGNFGSSWAGGTDFADFVCSRRRCANGWLKVKSRWDKETARNCESREEREKVIC